MKFFKKIEIRTRNYLSHYPKVYALIVGIGIVLFWRGTWHTVDNISTAISYLYSYSSTTLLFAPWWDGPLSFLVGSGILYITGAFTSSFIGSELILSGLRGEKKLNERTEKNLKEEVGAIGDIKEELLMISKKLELLEKQANNNHKGL
ncbi:MAG: hypothetical protein V4665_02525 [Patescibacteria group bacterium]